MHLWTIIICTIVATAIVVAVCLRKSKAMTKADLEAIRDQENALTEKERPIREWIIAVKAVRYEAEKVVAVGPPPEGWEAFEDVPELIARQDRAKEHLRERAERTKDANTYFIKIRQETDPVRQYEMLDNIDPAYLSNEEDKEWFNLQRRETTRTYVELLLRRARKGNQESFVKLDKFTEWVEYQGSAYKKHTGDHYQDPDDWADLVATHYENPLLDDFRIYIGGKNDPVPGAVRLLGAEALTSRSLRDAKIALAFCAVERYVTARGYKQQIYWPWRSELGDTLMAELAKMVVAIHAEKKMFVQ